jgi:hypothetical protein
MKILRILVRIGFGLFVVWGLIALFHRLTHEPEQSRFFFWVALPYPALVVLTVVIIAACARNGRSGGTGSAWFAVGLGSAASIGLLVAIWMGLYSVVSWAFFGYISFRFDAPTDSSAVGISTAMFVACYIWAGAITASLSPQRPVLHAIAAGGVLLLWSCAVTLLTQPLVSSQLLVASLLPIPFAAWGAWLQQARARTLHG